MGKITQQWQQVRSNCTATDGKRTKYASKKNLKWGQGSCKNNFKPTTATTTTCWKYSVWINSGKFACHFMAQQCQTHFKEISIWTSSWWYLYLSVFALFSYPLKISKTTTAADTSKGIRIFLSKKSAKLRPNRDFLTLSNCGSPFVKALAQISITDFA